MARGFENAGLNHLLLNEWDKDCVATLKHNFAKKAPIFQGDVREFDFSSFKDKADIVQAGFPCQVFSYAGKSMGFEDTRGTLLFEFARCVSETCPKIAVAENVKGLVNHDNGRTLQIGYRVKYKVLRAQYFDVPQKRECLIILAIRNDLTQMPFIFPKEQNYTVSLKETLSHCPKSHG